MSDAMDGLARQLLEKTENGKVLWNFVPEEQARSSGNKSEKYKTDIEGEYTFSISRTADGDNKTLGFELTHLGRTVRTEQVSNFAIGPLTQKLVEIRQQQGRPVSWEGAGDAPSASRFRLFSDLFHAARKSSSVDDRTIEEVQQLLERLG